jgi:hypothetical protein
MIRVLYLFMLLVPLAAQQADDDSAPIRDLLDRHLAPQLLQDRPALAIGALVFAMRELEKTLMAIDVNQAENSVQAKLIDGQILTWRCDPLPERTAASAQPKLLETHCSMEGMGGIAGPVPVLIEKERGRVVVRLGGEGIPEDQALFIGTKFPRTLPSWVPKIEDRAVDEVRLAVFVPAPVADHASPQLKASLLGRLVFDSESAESLYQRIGRDMADKGFVRLADVGDHSIRVASLPDGLFRFVRFGVTPLPNGKSRCDLLFAQVMREQVVAIK